MAKEIERERNGKKRSCKEDQIVYNKYSIMLKGYCEVVRKW